MSLFFFEDIGPNLFIFLNLVINFSGFALITLGKGLIAVSIKIQTKLDYQEFKGKLRPNPFPFQYIGTYNAMTNIFQLIYEITGTFAPEWFEGFNSVYLYLIAALLALVPMVYSLLIFEEVKVRKSY